MNPKAKNPALALHLCRFNDGDQYCECFLDGQDSNREVPMGVSQWREHGKKYGYWKYFEDEIKTAKIKFLKDIS